MACTTTEYDWGIMELSEELHSIWTKAQAFKSFAQADDIAITLHNSYWNLTVYYGGNNKYSRDFTTVEALSEQIDSFLLAAQIFNKLEV